MKIKLFSFIYFLMFFIAFSTNAQISSNYVNYSVTYSSATSEYTVWMIPSYSTPNSWNTATHEYGPTAQVSLAVPSTVTITSVTDINGNWQKPGTSGWLKYGPNEIADLAGKGLDAKTSYYTIGKSPSETDYGVLTAGTPLGLFSFKLSSCAGVVRTFSANEPVIKVGLDNMSWNLANSFYSRSGQNNTLGGNTAMAEQFKDATGPSANCSGTNTITATSENATVASGGVVNQMVLSNDLFNSLAATTSNVTVTILTQPSHGTAAVSNGTVNYTSTADYSGEDCYTYKICDNLASTNCATAQNCITVTATSSITATNDNGTVVSGASVTTNVLANDILNRTTATISLVNLTITTQPLHGTAAIQADGTIKYSSTAGYSGQDCYTYKICDKANVSTCSSAQACIAVNAATTTNTIVANTDNGSTTSGTSTTLSVLSNDTVNGATSTTANTTLSITAQPTNGTAVVQADGTVKYTPNATYVGTDCFTYKICNSSATTSCATAQACVAVSATVVPSSSSCGCMTITVK